MQNKRDHDTELSAQTPATRYFSSESRRRLNVLTGIGGYALAAFGAQQRVLQRQQPLRFSLLAPSEVARQWLLNK